MLIRPEDELEAWGKAQNLYLKSDSSNGSKSKSKQSNESEVVFKVISHVKGGSGSVSRLLNYVSRNHHEGEEKKHDQLFEVGSEEAFVCNEQGLRLSRHQIEKVKESWNLEFDERGDKGRVASHFVFSSDKIKDPLILSKIVHDTLAKSMGNEGFRYVTAVHNDTGALHCHVVVNTYSPVLQRKLHISKEWVQKQRMSFAEVSRDYGYEHVATMKKWRRRGVLVDKDILQPLHEIKDFGKAPYQNDKNNKDAFFVKLTNGQTLWGKGLESVMLSNQLDVGDKVIFSKNDTSKERGSSSVVWEVKTFTDKEIKYHEKQLSKQKLKSVEVTGYSEVVSKFEMLQKAKDIVRIEREIKSPTKEQKALLQNLKSGIPIDVINQAKFEYWKDNDPYQKSILKQVRFLESQKEKGIWKESSTMKALGIERSISDKRVKARIDALLSLEPNKDLLRSRFEKQNKVNALIQSIPLQRRLNPEKVPFLIERIKKDLPLVAMNEKSLIQLNRGLHNKTLPEFNKKIERTVKELNQAIRQRDLVQGNKQLGVLVSELKNKPKVQELSDLITKAKSQMVSQRAELKIELTTLRKQYYKTQKSLSPDLTASEKLKVNRNLDSIRKSVNKVERSLGFSETIKQTKKQSQTR